jgi:hypothetical protein
MGRPLNLAVVRRSRQVAMGYQSLFHARGDIIYIFAKLNTLSFCLAMLGRIILISCFVMPIVRVANAQSPVAIFNCSGFSSSGASVMGACEATFGSFSSPYFVMTGAFNGNNPSVVGSTVNIMPAACQHCAGALNYQQLVNIQKFRTTFTFVANGWNIAFVANNSNNNPSGNLANFSAGAGCEGGFFQGFAQAVAPNNVFALMYDQYSGLVAGSNSFTDSGVQYYSGSFAANAPNPPGQSPCNPNLGGTDFTYVGINKVATAPVHMNSPQNATFQTTCSNCTPSTSGVATGDTYSVTITYDGSNLAADMFDVTAGGTCTPVTSGTCSHVTWSGVNIPSMVGGNTAYVGLATSTADNDSSTPLIIYTFSYFSGYPLALTHDFNADGKSDIAWRDTSNDASNGTLLIWEMNGTGVLNPSATFVGNVAYPKWTIIGLGDFNGDGYSDILWRDNSGDFAIWEINGTQIINSSAAFVANITGWSVFGIGDFNGDGKADLLWTDGNGNYAIWEMNGTQILDMEYLAFVPTNWTVVGVGDFNGDGKSDILWEDQQGDYAIWEMNGTQIINLSVTFVANVPTNWKVLHIGDFNGDGKSDILWTDGSGNYAIWEMNGTQIVNPNATFVAAVTGWSVVGTGDYNGDGYSDILWTDGQGNYAIWEMTGTSFINSNATYLTNASTNWAVQLPLGQ